MATTCLQVATLYGTSSRMRFDLTVNEFTRDVIITGEVAVYGEQFWRPYVHVRDGARAIVEALDAPTETVAGDVFNMGATTENYPKLDIVEMLKELVLTADIQFVRKDEDPRDYRVRFEKIERRLGFTPTRRVHDGIAEIASLLEAGVIRDRFASIYRNETGSANVGVAR